MPLPTIYKDSLEGGAVTPQAVSSKEMDIQYPGTQKRCCSYTALFRVCDLFLPTNYSRMAVLPFCLFYHFPSKYFASSGRLCQASVCLLEDRILLICGIRLLLWQRLFTLGDTSQDGQSQPPFFLSSAFSDILTPTTAQIGLSLIINYIPGTWTLFCLPFKIGNYLALFFSFKLGIALLTVMTNSLVRAGIS